MSSWLHGSATAAFRHVFTARGVTHCGDLELPCHHGLITTDPSRAFVSDIRWNYGYIFITMTFGIVAIIYCSATVKCRSNLPETFKFASARQKLGPLKCWHWPKLGLTDVTNDSLIIYHIWNVKIRMYSSVYYRIYSLMEEILVLWKLSFSVIWRLGVSVSLPRSAGFWPTTVEQVGGVHCDFKVLNLVHCVLLFRACVFLSSEIWRLQMSVSHWTRIQWTILYC